MNAVVATELGAFIVDLDEEKLLTEDAPEPVPALEASVGSTRVRIVPARPPLLVSHDAGMTWRESGRGLPPGRAVAVSSDDPDVIVYASRNRLHVSTDGGRFWRTLAVELPEIRAVTVTV